MTERSKFPMTIYTEAQLETIFLEKLKHLCLQYDSKAGYWFDPELVGDSLYRFAKNPDVKMDSFLDVEDDEYDSEFRKLSGDYEDHKEEQSGFVVDSAEIVADENGIVLSMELKECFPSQLPSDYDENKIEEIFKSEVKK